MPERTCPCGKSFKAPPSVIAKGHGKYCSLACRGRFSDRHGERSPGWKGDAVGYTALHVWVRGAKGPPEQCSACGTTEGRLEWANVSHEYRRDVADWIALCVRCHRRFDSSTCKRGHERTPENTWIDRQGYPHCRPCRNERLRLQRRGQWDGELPHRSAIVDRFGKRIGW
jgi:hypothetical protein